MKTPVLRFVDPNIAMEIECDASQHGLELDASKRSRAHIVE